MKNLRRAKKLKPASGLSHTLRLNRSHFIDMSSLYDLETSKKATKLTLSSDLLVESKALNINLSATLEQTLREKLAEKEAENWAAENNNAIKAYSDFI